LAGFQLIIIGRFWVITEGGQRWVHEGDKGNWFRPWTKAMKGNIKIMTTRRGL